MAVSAAKFQSVTGFRGPVTAEVASSSLVVPAISFKHLQVPPQTNQGILGDDKRHKHFFPIPQCRKAALLDKVRLASQHPFRQNGVDKLVLKVGFVR